MFLIQPLNIFRVEAIFCFSKIDFIGILIGNITFSNKFNINLFLSPRGL
jgi:hypothetical protein